MKDLNFNQSSVITIKTDLNEIDNNFKINLNVIPTHIKSMNVGKLLSKFELKSEYKNFALRSFGKQYLEYCENSPYWLGCSFGHYMAITMAKQNNWPYVIIFEDDVVFVDDFKNKIQEIWESLPDNFETFVFGYDVVNMAKINSDQKLYNKLLYNGAGFKYCGAHSYIVNENAYDKVLNLLDDMYVADVAINNNSLKCFYSVKSLCNQPQFELL